MYLPMYAMYVLIYYSIYLSTFAKTENSGVCFDFEDNKSDAQILCSKLKIILASSFSLSQN